MKSSIERVNGRYVRYWHKADNLDPPINARFRGKTNNFQKSKILPIKIHGACSRLNLFWRCFERRRNPDRLRNRQRLRFKLIAYQDKRAKENGSSDQEVRQQRHSHRPFSQQRPIGLALQIWIRASGGSVLQITPATKFAMGCVVETTMSAIGIKHSGRVMNVCLRG